MKKALTLVLVCALFIPATVLSWDDLPNGSIANKALEYDGEYVGVQCKPFVQQRVFQALGKTLGSGYTSCYTASSVGVEISADEAVRGDII